MRKLLILICSCFSLSSLPVAAQDLGDVLELEWVDLLNQTDLEAMLNPPDISHEGYGWEDQLQESGEGEAYLNALESVDVNPEIIDKRVMIPGFIVPTAYDADRRVTEFFLVPFFGACIHLPPPPPNQIIYVSYERGVPLQNFYDAYVVHGLLTSDIVRNDTATSAYRIQADGVSPYSY
ncbi:MAG: hypothetical protein DHS20C12_14910 [Pseudohongiella sp.]|nr:MAG: hypothetical protein DHS20C12_14910 [Pseudohongiella sp.]